MAWKLVQGPVNPVWIVDAVQRLIGAVDSAGRIIGLAVSDTWRVTRFSEYGVNDSDKIIFTVPASEERHILMIGIHYTSSADAGNRQVEVRVENAAGTLRYTLGVSGVTQAASLQYEYLFAPGVADLTTARTDALDDIPYITTPIPVSTVLQAGDVLRVLDNEAIAAGADQMQVDVQYGYRGV